MNLLLIVVLIKLCLCWSDESEWTRVNVPSLGTEPSARSADGLWKVKDVLYVYGGSSKFID